MPSLPSDLTPSYVCPPVHIQTWLMVDGQSTFVKRRSCGMNILRLVLGVLVLEASWSLARSSWML